MNELKNKKAALLELLKDMGSVAVAFSGGVDSTFLLAVAASALGDRVLAIIGRSPIFPQRERDFAVATAKKLGVRYKIVDTREFDVPGFDRNPPDRCFLCKRAIFSAVWEIARAEGIETVVEGSNADDLGDYRPGMKALRELKVRSPLLELDFFKTEIRTLSKEMSLPTWNKPALACTASRIPYGQSINVEKLSRIENSEYALHDMGIEQLRVRDHGDVARIEVPQDEIERLSESKMRDKIVQALMSNGYRYVCLDLKGYRTGSMNETLTSKEKKRAVK